MDKDLSWRKETAPDAASKLVESRVKMGKQLWAYWILYLIKYKLDHNFYVTKSFYCIWPLKASFFLSPAFFPLLFIKQWDKGYQLGIKCMSEFWLHLGAAPLRQVSRVHAWPWSKDCWRPWEQCFWLYLGARKGHRGSHSWVREHKMLMSISTKELEEDCSVSVEQE